MSRSVSTWRRFVARASSLGFTVHAVAGGPNWTAETHRYLGPMTLQLIADYNSDVYPEERIRGVQFDIEPYVEDSFRDNMERSLQDYLWTPPDIVDAYEQVRTWYGNKGLTLGFAIPFWFDGTLEVPAVQFGESEEPKAAAFHLIDMLRNLPEAYVLVMAYRNHATGDDGSIEHIEREFGYASHPEVACACGIVTGQELTDVRPEPEKLSFWTEGRAAFRQAVAELTEVYGGLPQFRGISVDDIDTHEEAGEYGRP